MKTDKEILALDKRLKDAGMITLSDILKGTELSKFSLHKNVRNMDDFEKWLEMRYIEMMKLKTTMLLDEEDNDELYEWTLSHYAVLSEVYNQFNACKPPKQTHNNLSDYILIKIALKRIIKRFYNKLKKSTFFIIRNELN